MDHGLHEAVALKPVCTLITSRSRFVLLNELVSASISGNKQLANKVPLLTSKS